MNNSPWNLAKAEGAFNTMPSLDEKHAEKLVGAPEDNQHSVNSTSYFVCHG